MKNNFTNQIKLEICSLEFNKRKMIIFSYVYWKIVLYSNNVCSNILKKFKHLNQEIQTLIINLINFTLEQLKLEKITSITNIKTVNFSQINNYLSHLEKDVLNNNKNDYKIFIAAIFLFSGSMNSPLSNTYHLEFRLSNEVLINHCIKIIHEFNLGCKKTIIKNKTILYIKKSDQISDVLKLIGAVKCMFEFEDRRIYKDYTNQIHRLTNLDISNLKKQAFACQKQIAMINEIISDQKIYQQLSIKEKLYCKLRIEYPNASFQEMANIFLEKYNIAISKSTINHYSRKIRAYFLNKTNNF